MKALHLVQRYLPANLTGSEQAMVVLCEALAAETPNEIEVVTSDVTLGEGFYDPRVPRIQVKQETINGVSVTRLPPLWWLSSILYLAQRFLPFLNQLTGGWLGLLSFGPILVGLERTIVTAKPDLLHVTPMPMSQVYLGWQISRRHKIPLVVTPAMHFEDKRFANPLIYKILASAEAVIAHTQYGKAQLIKKGIAADKITVIPSSYVAESDFRLADSQTISKKYALTDCPVVLFIGSKSLDKGTIDLVKAWPIIRLQSPSAKLVIAGITTASWERAKSGLDLSNVLELDYIDETTKQQFLSRCDLLAIPSRAESFGMVLLEAWAKGKPVIGGPAGATRELIEEGVNGYTVEFGAVEALSNKIIELLTDKKKAVVMGQAGRKKAKTFTKALIVERTLAIYQRVLKSNQSLSGASRIIV